MDHQPDYEIVSIKLPEGRICADCVHFVRCSWLFRCRAESRVCDWVPNRFEERPTETVIDWQPIEGR